MEAKIHKQWTIKIIIKNYGYIILNLFIALSNTVMVMEFWLQHSPFCKSLYINILKLSIIFRKNSKIENAKYLVILWSTNQCQTNFEILHHFPEFLYQFLKHDGRGIMSDIDRICELILLVSSLKALVFGNTAQDLSTFLFYKNPWGIPSWIWTIIENPPKITSANQRRI